MIDPPRIQRTSPSIFSRGTPNFGAQRHVRYPPTRKPRASVRPYQLIGIGPRCATGSQLISIITFLIKPPSGARALPPYDLNPAHRNGRISPSDHALAACPSRSCRSTWRPDITAQRQRATGCPVRRLTLTRRRPLRLRQLLSTTFALS